MSALPRGWVEVTLGEVFSLIRGLTYSKEDVSHESSEGFVALLRANNIQHGQIDLGDLIYLPLSIVKDDQILRVGDIVLATSSGSRTVVGKAARVTSGTEGATFGAFCGVIRPRFPNVDMLLLQYMRSRAYRDYVEAVAIGTNINNFRTSDIQRMAIPLPPLAEQKRIVAKLDALNAKSARARTELGRIETLVSRYKQAVLSKAFSGELSRSQTRFGQFIETAGNGLSKREGDEGDWINVLRLTDLSQGQFAPEEPRQIRLTSKEVDKYRLTEGDLVVIRVNGSANLVGRSFCFNASDVWAFCDHFIRIKLKSSMDPEFTALFLNSPQIRGIIEHKFVSTSGQKTISQKTLEELPAPLIPLEKQHEIVRRIESAFAKIDRLAKEAKRALELVGRLDEAILAKAFRGELIPQDENDEPAEHLLARIRAERANAPTRRGRKSSKT